MAWDEAHRQSEVQPVGAPQAVPPACTQPDSAETLVADTEPEMKMAKVFLGPAGVW